MPSLKNGIFSNKQGHRAWELRVSLCREQLGRPGGVGILQGSAMPTFLLVSAICHIHVSTGAKTIFTSKFQQFCHFRHDFQTSDVCIKGGSIVELEMLGGKVVGGGVKENCEYSELIFTEKKCHGCERLVYYFRTSSRNMLQQLKSYKSEWHLLNVCKFLISKGNFKNRL